MKEREYIAKHGHETIGSYITITVLKHEIEAQGGDTDKIKCLLWSRYLNALDQKARQLDQRYCATVEILGKPLGIIEDE